MIRALGWLLALIQAVLGARVVWRLWRTGGDVPIRPVPTSAVAAGAVAIIVPVLDEAQRLPSCLDGLLTQGLEVAEMLIVDGGSTDDTARSGACLRSPRPSPAPGRSGSGSDRLERQSLGPLQRRASTPLHRGVGPDARRRRSRGAGARALAARDGARTRSPHAECGDHTTPLGSRARVCSTRRCWRRWCIASAVLADRHAHRAAPWPTASAAWSAATCSTSSVDSPSCANRSART